LEDYLDNEYSDGSYFGFHCELDFTPQLFKNIGGDNIMGALAHFFVTEMIFAP